MASRVVRRRRDGLVEIAPPSRLRWVLYAMAGLFVSLPLALSAFMLVPPVVLALPMMTLYLVVWVVFRRLDLAPPHREPRRQAGRR